MAMTTWGEPVVSSQAPWEVQRGVRPVVASGSPGTSALAAPASTDAPSAATATSKARRLPTAVG